MYKIGDKIKALTDYNNGDYHHSKNDIIEVLDISQHSGTWLLRNTVNGLTVHWGFHGANYYSLIQRIPPKNDIEWLDRVKENFKNG